MMKITTNGPNTLHMDTYAGTGSTVDEAIKDALKDVSPLNTPDVEYVVAIVKIIVQTKEVKNRHGLQ